jgi:hypothetical protein
MASNRNVPPPKVGEGSRRPQGRPQFPVSPREGIDQTLDLSLAPADLVAIQRQETGRKLAGLADRSANPMRASGST